MDLRVLLCFFNFADVKVIKDISSKVEKRVAEALRGAGTKRVVAGISGGADSTALLLALKSAGADVVAIHCNFHLRGEESMRDQKAVEKLCRKYDIPLRIVDFDVDGYRNFRKGMSVEMACRELRYEKFHEIMRETSADRIAIAHNSDDNIETLFINLFRGSGVTGLRAMLPDTGILLRPLLDISREDIEKYLLEKGETFVVDSTNLESDYRRNFLRNDIIPLLEGRWKGIRKTISTTIENLRGEERVLKWAEKELLAEGDFLPMQSIFDAPDRFWLIYRFASRHGATRDIALEILDVFEKKGGKQTIVGKSWKSGQGKLFFTMKGLMFNN